MESSNAFANAATTLDLSTITRLLGPVFALNAWTLVMEGVMFYYRLPVYQRLNLVSQNTLTREEIDKKVPASVRFKGDNFNHLMEQPTNFYAVMLALALAHGKLSAGGETALRTDVALAWGYVALRIIHSFVQASSNQVLGRFKLFVTSSVVLGALTARGGLMVWRGL